MYIFSMECHHEGINAVELFHPMKAIPPGHCHPQLVAEHLVSAGSRSMQGPYIHFSLIQHDNPSYALRQCQRHGSVAALLLPPQSPQPCPACALHAQAMPPHALQCPAAPTCPTTLPAHQLHVGSPAGTNYLLKSYNSVLAQG